MSGLKYCKSLNNNWNFPNGLGGVDGRHIVLQQPKSFGSHYRNYKGTDSIILLAMVGPEYEFLFVDVRMNVRNSDGGKLVSVLFEEWFREKTLNFPDSTPLPGRNYPLPYVCTGDDAYPLTVYMMKPYPQKNLSLEKCMFN